MTLSRLASRCSAREASNIAVAIVIFAGVSSAIADDSVHYQGGVPHPVQLDEDHVMVITDGSIRSVDLAIDLSTKNLATSLSPSADSKVTFVANVGSVSQEHLKAVRKQPGVVSVLRVLRFREGGEAFGITGDIVVKLDPSTAVDDLETQYDLRLKEAATQELGLPGVYIFEVLGGNSLERVAALHADPRPVDWKVHADLIAPLFVKQATPQDSLFDLQWHLENTGQFGGTSRADIDVLEAWETTTGSGVRVGMHDDGCDVFHEDLSPNFLGISQDPLGGDIDKGFGHGTAVMGLMVAAANTIGVRGVAPAARFTASGFGGSNAMTAAAYTFAVNNNVDVHNNSWGFPIGVMPDVVVEAIQEAANKGRDGKGMVIAFAAGNRGIELKPGDDLSTLSEVIQVGATGYTDTMAGYSDYGVSQDVMGPSLGNDGIGLVTTDITGQDGFNDGQVPWDILGEPNYTKNMSGTSGSSPVVTGVAALVLSENPNLNRHQVREVLTHTSEKVSPLDANYNETTGFSLRYGYGRVNAAEAVDAASTSRNGNLAWPGIPTDTNAGTNDPEGDVDLAVTISWIPSGMPPDEEGDPVEETEEVEVLIVNKDPSSDTFDEGINFMPEDGQSYDGGDPDVFDDGDRPDSDDFDLIVLYRGVGELEGRRRIIRELAISGNEGDDQLFAVYAINSQDRYSYGAVFDEEGESIGGGDVGGGGIVLPPDIGRPIDPELTPVEPGKNDPPSVSATANLTFGTAPLTVEFHGNAVTPNQIEDRGWSLGDGSSSSQESITHTYQQPGTYFAVFFAQDENGDISTKRLQIEVQVADGDSGSTTPGTATATIRLETTGPHIAPNALVRFSVDTTGIGESSSDSVVSYLWDFGDGHSGEGQATENIYAGPGFYSVVVTVTEVRSNGQITQVTASIFVEIQGTSSSAGQSSPPPQNSDVDSSSAGNCGMMSPAMIAMTLLGVISLRLRRRSPLAEQSHRFWAP